MKQTWCKARELQEGDVKSCTANGSDMKETKISERGKAALQQTVVPLLYYAEGSN